MEPASTLAATLESLAHAKPSAASSGPHRSLATSIHRSELSVVEPSFYTNRRFITRQGVGRISLARDRRLGRVVVLNEMLRLDPELDARFEREALVTARLEHPGIVSVHEAGRWPTGEPFYAMRLVTGQTFD